MPYGDLKDLTRWTTSDKMLIFKTFNIAKNPKYDGYKRGLASMIFKVFDKRNSTKELAKELQKTINRKFEGAELTDL